MKNLRRQTMTSCCLPISGFREVHVQAYIFTIIGMLIRVRWRRWRQHSYRPYVKRQFCIEHPADIHQMLVFALAGFTDERIDLSAISEEATRLGPEALELWQRLLTRAESEVAKLRSV